MGEERPTAQGGVPCLAWALVLSAYCQNCQAPVRAVMRLSSLPATAVGLSYFFVVVDREPGIHLRPVSLPRCFVPLNYD
jgi:hypothetical protein